ncbi:excisionase family DNA-binding protein [Methylobacterium radiotolerans]|uniref:excisionase family DNA-binding protein n=1 Tax=Methylobacterium radiotolerans TaxID=31998 RepID=UPI0015F734A7|nr:excisionase family DNA-binding protein [Methylobacterium radiotolerans]
MTGQAFNIGEAAAYVGISREMLSRKIAAGHIRVYRLGYRTVRIAKADLDAWLERCSTGPVSRAA